MRASGGADEVLFLDLRDGCKGIFDFINTFSCTLMFHAFFFWCIYIKPQKLLGLISFAFLCVIMLSLLYLTMLICFFL